MLNNVLGVLGTPTPPVTSSYESIQTFTVGAGGTASITFGSGGTIPQTYKHLQLRILGQTNRGTYGIDEMYMRFNGDTGTNYSWHSLTGQGSGTPVTNNSGSGTNYAFLGAGSIGTTTGGSFGASICDIVDYSNTSKNKTARNLSGVDLNGTVSGLGGWITLDSSSWRSTSAITSITLTPANGTIFTQYSSFALYGIKG